MPKSNEDIQCPVCGYYCLGNGGVGCIDKPSMVNITEEYTGPRRCDLCEDEKKAPCPGKGCNIVNDLKDFKLKGSETEDTGCETCSHWAAVKIGKFCPDCAQALR